MSFESVLALIPVNCIAVDMDSDDVVFSKWGHEVGGLVGQRFTDVVRVHRDPHDIVRDIRADVGDSKCVASSSQINGWVAWFFMDVSHEVQIESDLHRSNQDLEQFAYAASHDLQEPLRMITRFSGMLVEELTGLTAEQKEYLSYVMDGAHRMSLLVNGLLGYSRVGAHRMFEEVNLSECMASVKMALYGEIEASKAVIVEEDLPSVYGDRVMLSSLFQNLIGNSIKYATGAPNVRVAWTDLGTHWHVFVEDESGGFDPKHANDVFQMFRRVGHDRSGSGIGLAVCRKIVTMHDGEIWATSELGVGTCIHLTLRKPDA